MCVKLGARTFDYRRNFVIRYVLLWKAGMFLHHTIMRAMLREIVSDVQNGREQPQQNYGAHCPSLLQRELSVSSCKWLRRDQEFPVLSFFPYRLLDVPGLSMPLLAAMITSLFQNSRICEFKALHPLWNSHFSVNCWLPPPLPHTRTHLCIWSWFSDLPSRFSSITVTPQTMDAGKWDGHLGWRGPGRGAIRGMHKAKGTERNHCSWRHFRGFWGTAAKDQDVRLLWGYADVEEYRSITFTKLKWVVTEYYNVPPGQLYIATPPQLTKLPFEIHTKCTLVLQ